LDENGERYGEFKEVTKDIREVYFFERKGKKYKRKNLIMTFDPAIIFYPSDLIKEKSE